jgi:hypothetical protein
MLTTNERACHSMRTCTTGALRVYGASGQAQALFLTKPRPDRVTSLSLLGTLATPPQATGRPPLTSQPPSLALALSLSLSLTDNACAAEGVQAGTTAFWILPPAVAKTGFFRYARGRCARNCRLGSRAQAITHQQAAASNRRVRYMHGCTSYRSILV